jgi:FKBP-type peptidyl-prolyl cis-trans isomerase
MTQRPLHRAALCLLLAACTPNETPVSNPPPNPIPSALPPATVTATSEPKPLLPPPRVTQSGLEIEELRAGTGKEAHAGDTVSVHYVGTLTTGSEFDNSRTRGTPIDFKLGAHQVIAGWDEGIEGMRVGQQRRLRIPPDLAYGPRGRPGIPPNATLIFEVELMNVR